MTDIVDDTGVYDLLGGVVRRAEMDAKRGKPEIAADAGSFLEWIRGQQQQLDEAYARIDERLARINGETPATPKPVPAPEQLSREEIADRVRRLTDLGISPQWAAVQADPAKMAAAERQQRRRDLATRLGVLPQYLPEGAEDEI